MITKLTKHVKTSKRSEGGYAARKQASWLLSQIRMGFVSFGGFVTKVDSYEPNCKHHHGKHQRSSRSRKSRAVLRDEMEIPFEMNALSAHRTPQEVETFAREAQGRGIKVIIAAAGMAAALPGVIAANTTLPVIGVPVKGMLDGLDAMLSIIQMPPGIPVATVGVNGALNAAILAAEMLALGDTEIAAKVANYKENLKNKITKANAELKEVQYKFKTN